MRSVAGMWADSRWRLTERPLGKRWASLAYLVHSPELRTSMSAEARRLAEREFDLRRQTALLEELYDRVVAEGRHAPR